MNTRDEAVSFLKSNGYKGIANHTSMPDMLVEYAAKIMSEQADRIQHLEQGISNWVRVSNERQEELNEAERRVKELEERLESQKGNMVIDKEFVDNLSQGFKGKRFKTK